jgi:type VI protein secretion system component VasA
MFAKNIRNSVLKLCCLLKSGNVGLEAVTDAKNFLLHCVPVVNLFSRNSDRIPGCHDAF